MPKFHKKPVVIEAFQWTGDTRDEIDFPEWMKVARNAGDWTFNNDDGENRLRIVTLEGVMYAEPSGYVVKSAAGDIYPMKPDIFEATYEIEEA